MSDLFPPRWFIVGTLGVALLVGSFVYRSRVVAEAGVIHFVTTHNMIELTVGGMVGPGSAYREKYGWLCVRPNEDSVFERSDVVMDDTGNPLLVCYWRSR